MFNNTKTTFGGVQPLPVVPASVAGQEEKQRYVRRRLEARRLVAQARLRASSFPSQAHVQKRGRRQSR